LGEKQQH
jgi:hypothetical protein